MKLLRIDKSNLREQAEHVAEKIKQGAVIVCPTDTVYGLVCDGLNEQSKSKIYDLKQRPQNKPLIGFVPNIREASLYARIEPRTIPFIKKQWPGTVTFIFHAEKHLKYLNSEKKEIALRIPDHPFIRELLKHIGILASTSANISSGKTPSSIKDIPPAIRKNADILIDGGKSPGRESTIWNLTGPEPKLLRGKILTVCSENSCRSPMAEYFLKTFMKEHPGKIQVESAGINVSCQGPISKKTVEVMEEEGIDMKNARSKGLNLEKVEDADIICVMDQGHKNRIIAFAPAAEAKIIILNIPIPDENKCDFYRTTRDNIKKSIKNIVAEKITGY